MARPLPKIGNYECLELLGIGGMGEVYRGRIRGAKGFEKELAIKRIQPGSWGGDEKRQKFEEEARLTSLLNHPNIVQVFDFVSSAESCSLVMEYIDGLDLRQILECSTAGKSRVPLDFAVYVINEICKGLDYAHRKKNPNTGEPLAIVHRDISPKNIMVSIEGAVKIVDFGIAKVRFASNQTRHGIIKGTICYMSPEQARGERVDRRSDVFSTGMLLYELVTGILSFDEDEGTILERVQAGALIDLRPLSKELPSDLVSILARALASRAEDRYSTAGQMHEDLQLFLSAHFPGYSQLQASLFVRSLTGKALPAPASTTSSRDSASLSAKSLLREGMAELGQALAASGERGETSGELPLSRSGHRGSRGFLIAALLLLTIGVGTWVTLHYQNRLSDSPERDVAAILPTPSLPAEPAVSAIPSPAPSFAAESAPSKAKEEPVATPPPLVPSRPPTERVAPRVTLRLVSPTRGQEFFSDDGLSPMFSWKGKALLEDGEGYYQVELSRDRGFRKIHPLRTRRNVLSAGETNLRAGTYFWRVRLIGPSRTTVALSESGFFTLQDASLPPPPPSQLRLAPQ